MWCLLALLLTPTASATAFGDMADLYGVRGNPLQGVGVVIGLNKTGDSGSNPAAVDTLAKMMQGLGMAVTPDQMKSRNIAMVMVTAELPANPAAGMRLDVQVASTGDAKSLQGGTLLLTQLMAGNGVPFATATGSVIVGGFSAGSGGDSVVENHPTVGIVPGGAIVERELPADPRTDFGAMVSLRWILREGSFTNVVQAARAINATIACECAVARDSRLLDVSVPDTWLGRQVELVAAIEAVDVTVRPPARVVVSERTGVVVMGADITVHAVVITAGGLTVAVNKNVEVSQPNAFGAGETKVVGQTEVSVTEAGGKVSHLQGGTVGEIVNALNDLGATPRQVIGLLQAMKAAGAIDAPIVVQ